MADKNAGKRFVATTNDTTKGKQTNKTAMNNFNKALKNSAGNKKK